MPSVLFTYGLKGKDIPVPSKYVTIVNNTFAQMDKPIEESDTPNTLFYNCWINGTGTQPSASQTVYTDCKFIYQLFIFIT